MIIYKAFGLYLMSTVPIAQLQLVQDKQSSDVAIHDGNLKKFREILPVDIHCLFRKNQFFFEMPRVGSFLVQNGNEIIFDLCSGVNNDLCSAYLMGPCMGAILHQRGSLPLHGSCVTDGKDTILITGESGAGKSTLAAEFLAHGWKLITDDVAAVQSIEEIPVVQPSYPSQKLWQDSLKKYQKSIEEVHTLYARTEGTKFGVDVSEYFSDVPQPLSLIVRLTCADSACRIDLLRGAVRIDQLMRNTYNVFMVMPEVKQRFFQNCVALATKVSMIQVIRENGKQCATELYEMIIDYLEEANDK